MDSTIAGFWGNRTATIDWCEKNYEVTYYIAEFWNTVTNLIMILLPLWGIREIFKQNLDRRFICSYLFLMVVGFGSWSFHMTLLYSMQLMDELPMVWGACYLFYSLYESHLFGRVKNDVKIQYAKITSIGFAIMFTVLYLIWPIPLFHNLVYGILISSSYYLEVQLIADTKCKTCKNLCIASFLTCAFAFFLWNIDRHFCSRLTYLRESLPTSAMPLTQLHGWWHLLVGYGVYLQILFCIHGYYDIYKVTDKKLLLTDYYITVKWDKRDKTT